jgi:hypothetical protein
MIVYVSTIVVCLIGNPSDCQTIELGRSFPLECCERHTQMRAEQWLKMNPDYELKSTSCDPKDVSQ